MIVAIDPSHKEAGGYDLKTSLVSLDGVGGEYQISGHVIKDAGSTGTEAFSDEDVSPEEFDKMLYSAETLRKTTFEENESRVPKDDTKNEPEVQDESEVQDEPM